MALGFWAQWAWWRVSMWPSGAVITFDCGISQHQSALTKIKLYDEKCPSLHISKAMKKDEIYHMAWVKYLLNTSSSYTEAFTGFIGVAKVSPHLSGLYFIPRDTGPAGEVRENSALLPLQTRLHFTPPPLTDNGGWRKLQHTRRSRQTEGLQKEEKTLPSHVILLSLWQPHYQWALMDLTNLTFLHLYFDKRCIHVRIFPDKSIQVTLPSTQEGKALVVPATCPGKHEHLTVWERSSILFLLQQRWAATTSHIPVLSCDDPEKEKSRGRMRSLHPDFYICKSWSS